MSKNREENSQLSVVCLAPKLFVLLPTSQLTLTAKHNKTESVCYMQGRTYKQAFSVVHCG